MAKVAPQYEFDVERSADFARYRVAGVGLGFFTIFAVIFLFAIFGAMAAVFVGLTSLAISVAFAVLIIYTINSVRKRSSAITIDANSITIEKSGSKQDYERKSIKNISLYNEKTKRDLQSAAIDQGGHHLIFMGTGIAGVAAAGFSVVSSSLNRAASATGKAVGQAAAEETARRAWTIRILYGTKYIFLVKNLKQATAEALYIDICTSMNAL